MQHLAEVPATPAASRETPEMARSHIVLAAGPGALAQLRDALASPTYAGLVAAVAGGWQGLIKAMPEQTLGLIIAGTLVAVADTILGIRRARREGRAAFGTFLTKVGDKLASRFGVFSAAIWIGSVRGTTWQAVGAVALVLGAFEVLSLLGHAKALRADSEAEGAFIDRLASMVGMDKLIDSVVSVLGGAGEKLRAAKSKAAPTEQADGLKPAPNGGP